MFLGIFRGATFLGNFRGPRSSEIPDANSEEYFVGTSEDWTIGNFLGIYRGSSPSVYSEELSDDLVVLGVSSEIQFLGIPSEISEGFPRKNEFSKSYFRGLLSSCWRFSLSLGDMLELLESREGACFILVCGGGAQVTERGFLERRRARSVVIHLRGIGAWFQFISFLSRREVRFMYGLLQVQGEEPIPQPDILMVSSNDFSSIWCFSDCICYGSRPLRLDYVEVWTSERAFEPGDDIVWKALGGSDRSGLRRRSVFYSTSGLYHLAG
ncbi:hypothetical protein F2Q69_00037439 [Brassica cretica]|uniref:Uncharacterized protein n=1 Tax=Brassica cretica TaxID=69181 RepID=A0A8S9SQV2_BRACR|nr:hypothetical protein F2Q69_00037439 [Brassica cretica]